MMIKLSFKSVGYKDNGENIKSPYGKFDFCRLIFDFLT